METAPLLQVRHLTKRFPIGNVFKQRHVHALTDVSFDINAGEVVALVGESGSGKSTTARLIARLLQPSSGEIVLKGENILAREPRKASLRYRNAVQMIFQDPFGSLNPVHTIAHHLARPLSIHHRVKQRSEMREQIHQLLERVGLTPAAIVASKYPHQLSGGQRQRVAIARALAVMPEIILADEPISMLDVSIRIGILNLLERLKHEYGIGYLYITHDIASARYFADRTQVMYAGYMVEGAVSEEVIQHPAHPYTQLLLSAVPNPRERLSNREIAVRGEVPSLIDPPPGCPFANRCPQVKAECRQRMPDVTYLDSGHWVRCHLYPASTPSA